MRILYNIQDIQSKLDSVDERTDFLLCDRLISAEYNQFPARPTDEKELLSWNLHQLSSFAEHLSSWEEDGNYKSSGCFSFVERINRYLYVIRQNLSSTDEIFINEVRKTTKNSTNSSNSKIELSSNIVDVQSTNEIFSLTEYSDHFHETFDLLSTFCDKTFTDILSSQNMQSDEIDLLDGDSRRKKLIKSLLNFQNCSDSFFEYDNSSAGTIVDRSDFLLKYAFKSYLVVDPDTHVSYRHTTTIEASDILYLLKMYLELLKNTKYVVMSWFHKTNITNTRIRSKGNIKLKNINNIDLDGESLLSYQNIGTNVNLIISPWTVSTQNTPAILKFRSYLQSRTGGTDVSYPTPQNYQYITYTEDTESSTVEKIDLGIILQNLVYDNSAHANLLQNIPTNPGGTNGIFGHELTVTERVKFKLTLDEIKEKFGIFPGKLISRRSLLNAIDYIFRYWIENITILTYTITTCHNNCHTNDCQGDYKSSVENFYSGYVYGDGYLRYTGGECGCSTVEHWSINLYDMIKKRLPDGFDTSKLILGKVEFSFTKGNFTENTNALSHLYVKLNDTKSDFVDSFKSRTSIPYTLTDVPVKSGTNEIVEVESQREGNKWDNKHRYCLQINVRAKYVYSEVEEDDSDD